MSGAEKRRKAERRGRLAETLAAIWLALKGYRILAARWRGPGGELDLVAAKGDMLVIVEVKQRAGETAPGDAVMPQARRRIERAAEAFLSSRPAFASAAMRFDVIMLAGWRLRHYRDAWRAGD